jgi:hypothetical protein
MSNQSNKTNNPASNNDESSKLPLKLIGQIFLVLVILVLVVVFGWKITSLSILGFGLEPPSTNTVSDGVYDTFDNKSLDGKWDDKIWTEFGTISQIEQRDGVLMLSRETDSFGGLVAYKQKWHWSQIDYLESKIMLSSNIQTKDGDIGVEINTTINGDLWFAKCAIRGVQGENSALILCDTADKFSIEPIEVSYDTWHVVKLDIDNDNPSITFIIDGKNAGKYIPQNPEGFKFPEFSLMVDGWSSVGGFISGSFDYVHLKTK